MNQEWDTKGIQKQYTPVIVVVAFNRSESLKRILGSLLKAHYPIDTPLIISIDNNGTNQEVLKIAENFNWKYGVKEIVYQKERFGLKKHIISCGDLSNKYGSVIVLEDDLVVSPFFYQYAQEALNYYDAYEEIAGISLYKLTYTEAAKLPFIPLCDDSDVYFKQVPSSLGQAWSDKQWNGFKTWFDQDHDLEKIVGLPLITTKYWGSSSWKKYFYGYIVDKNKFFVYPQVALTSNFNDRGENMYAKSHFGQVGLQMVNMDYKFKSLTDSINVYDAYSEILPDRLKLLCSELRNYDFEVDLFGQKESFSKEFILTTKSCKNIILSYERTMKPAELNVIYNIPGTEINLVRSEDAMFNMETINNIIFRTKPIKEFISDYHYFYINIFDSKKLIKILNLRLKNKIRKLLNLN